MRQTIRIGTFDGIAVGVNWSVAAILALFAWELAVYILPTHSGHADGADWIAGVIGAVVLLGSLLAHEVSHALVARHNGVRVRSITLFVFGGVAQLEGEAHTPGADFRIAAVGPGVSLLLAMLFGAMQMVAVAAGIHGLPIGVLSWLWEINLLLAIFNLIPAAPLDGGRILRAGLWHRSGDHFRASVTAARAGRIFAVVLVVLGVMAFVSTGSVIGLWPALIGFFVYSAARGEEEYALIQGAIANLTVGQVMTPALPSVPSRTTVADMASFLWVYRGDIAAVTDDSGQLSGVVTAQAVSAVPLERRPVTTSNEIIIPLSAIPVAHSEEPMSALLERMVSREGHPALVLDANNRVTGTVSSSDLQRAAAFGAGRQPRSA
jgi:Zn-dependent protease